MGHKSSPVVFEFGSQVAFALARAVKMIWLLYFHSWQFYLHRVSLVLVVKIPQHDHANGKRSNDQ
jgi:hypothetical protein